MSRVFIPSMRLKQIDGEMVPSVNVKKAEAFGQLVEMFPPNNEPVTSTQITEIAEKAMDIGEDDYLLAVGDVVLFGVAMAQAHINNGVVKVMRWDRETNSYEIVEASWDDGLEDADAPIIPDDEETVEEDEEVKALNFD